MNISHEKSGIKGFLYFPLCSWAQSLHTLYSPTPLGVVPKPILVSPTRLVPGALKLSSLLQTCPPKCHIQGTNPSPSLQIKPGMQLLRGMERMEAIDPSWILIVWSKGHHLVNIWNEKPWKWVGKGVFYCGECPQGFLGSWRRWLSYPTCYLGTGKELHSQVCFSEVLNYWWCSVSLIFNIRAGGNIKIIFPKLRKILFGMWWENPKVKHNLRRSDFLFVFWHFCFGSFEFC